MANNKANKFKQLVSEAQSSLDLRIDYKRQPKSYMIVLSKAKNLLKTEFMSAD